MAFDASYRWVFRYAVTARRAFDLLVLHFGEPLGGGRVEGWPSHLNKPAQLYPWIKLSGRWIEHAGFLPGQQVRITVERGKLIISRPCKIQFA